jgi:hypothetical protein
MNNTALSASLSLSNLAWLKYGRRGRKYAQFKQMSLTQSLLTVRVNTTFLGYSSQSILIRRYLCGSR